MPESENVEPAGGCGGHKALKSGYLLIIHFALRKWRFTTAMRSGLQIFALSIPAAGVSVILWAGGTTWDFWMGGLLYLLWAIFGYTVEYIKGIQWRSPMRWSVGGPYLILYLATV